MGVGLTNESEVEVVLQSQLAQGLIAVQVIA